MVSVLAPPLAAALAAAPADAAAAVRATFEKLIEPYSDADGVHVPVRALACIAS